MKSKPIWQKKRPKNLGESKKLTKKQVNFAKARAKKSNRT